MVVRAWCNPIILLRFSRFRGKYPTHMITPSTLWQAPRVAIACDHAGFPLKAAIIRCLQGFDCAVTDCGTRSDDPVDYPDYAYALAEALRLDEAELGILLCGSGNGIAIAANRHAHIRAAVCHNATAARFARAHNDANVLAMGARFIGSAVMLDCVEAFIHTEFEGGRHATRVEKLGKVAA